MYCMHDLLWLKLHISKKLNSQYVNLFSIPPFPSWTTYCIHQAYIVLLLWGNGFFAYQYHFHSISLFGTCSTLGKMFSVMSQIVMYTLYTVERNVLYSHVLDPSWLAFHRLQLWRRYQKTHLPRICTHHVCRYYRHTQLQPPCTNSRDYHTVQVTPQKSNHIPWHRALTFIACAPLPHFNFVCAHTHARTHRQTHRQTHKHTCTRIHIRAHKHVYIPPPPPHSASCKAHQCVWHTSM